MTHFTATARDLHLQHLMDTFDEFLVNNRESLVRDMRAGDVPENQIDAAIELHASRCPEWRATFYAQAAADYDRLTGP